MTVLTNSVSVTQPTQVSASITPNPINDHLYFGYSGDLTHSNKGFPNRWYRKLPRFNKDGSSPDLQLH